MRRLLAESEGSMDWPLRLYLLLAFGITWGVGGLVLLTGGIRSGAAHPLHPLHYLAAFGPSIAGFIMAASIEGWAGVQRLLARLQSAEGGRKPGSAVAQEYLAA
jgi:hypothetical protein